MSSPWISAIRPKTLGLSVSPVLLGTILGVVQQGRIHWLPALAALLAAMAIQIGTNLHNDAADHLKGTDTPDRLGPARASALGLLDPWQVKQGALAAFGLAFLLGIYLVIWGGWPILLLGLASLLAGAAYSGGPWPISESPLGEIFVGLFFGLGAVAGSFYLQTGQWDGKVLSPAGALGAFAAAVLVVNNYRDRFTDALAGRRTLAVLLPLSASRVEYALLMLGPFLLPGVLWRTQGFAWLLLPALAGALYLVYLMYHLPHGRELNRLLGLTARFQLIFSLLFCVQLLLEHQRS
ncbi:1,4-dihydroxy-2-naphthoate octaprenyltransferase [Thiolapillus brandeum]|uniref:1,4-dihydroxy-2-naphthoate octaprenyltransferase n=1 Tax=Thiolapillus brandeum TaxID=1076588 RepID=A0A7U6GH78_9GAMM|nr:1,4-dihydroxy-2-naphthoate octaprenyltransferase [Thiolapillus brandeum]BAO43572.1 14-dihydroxy-2-naphthoate octaprenyltransferase [Thiolapillus brandeum]